MPEHSALLVILKGIDEELDNLSVRIAIMGERLRRLEDRQNPMTHNTSSCTHIFKTYEGTAGSHKICIHCGHAEVTGIKTDGDSGGVKRLDSGDDSLESW